ncbi:hypothetical protein SAMN06295924_102318 [Rathayibacter rathayi NCPPB 2980 = VKM Ac-1601]|nr:hypothetical protein SAMN06295924_102318 [Rathayibacter rathayi NCPPB 2980 = VKM Ac-1601]
MAEEAAATDLISGGRLELGVSRGSPETALRGSEAFGFVPPEGMTDAGWPVGSRQDPDHVGQPRDDVLAAELIHYALTSVSASMRTLRRANSAGIRVASTRVRTVPVGGCHGAGRKRDASSIHSARGRPSSSSR